MGSSIKGKQKTKLIGFNLACGAWKNLQLQKKKGPKLAGPATTYSASGGSKKKSQQLLEKSWSVGRGRQRGDPHGPGLEPSNRIGY